MKIILFILLITNFLFSVIINNKYVISKTSLSGFINANRIYEYIKKNPIAYKNFKKKSFFSFSDFSEISSYDKSFYDKFYIFNTDDKNYVYVQIPSNLLKDEFNIKKQSKNYILRFKTDFTQDKLQYLRLDTGIKKEISFSFNSEDIRDFTKKYSNLLFDKNDFFDSIKIYDDKITITSNYSKKYSKISFYLQDFLRLKNNKIISKNIKKTFVIKVDEDLPPLICDNKNLLSSIFIDEQEWSLGEKQLSNSLYSLYVLNYESKFNEFLRKNIKFINLKSKLKNNIHTLSYTGKYKNINIILNLPRNINYQVKSKFINSFNSFKFKINGTTFDGYVNNKKTYQIQNNICNNNKNKSIKIVNTKNYSEFKKWDMKIDNKTKSITWTPKFKIHKIKTTIYAPFLLKKANKYVTNSLIDEESNMDGEIKYYYEHNGNVFQNKIIVNPKTNTNFYFKYPNNSALDTILKKTKFIYNSNPIEVVQLKKESIKFTSGYSNKVALIYFPTGNIDSFRRYFLRYFECSKVDVIDEETCFNYLADMESAMGSFLNKLRQTKKYTKIIYRKNTYKEKDKKNLIIFNRSNKVYEQASDEQVLGKSYDNYKWYLSNSLEYDKKILQNYGLKNIDLIYFSNIKAEDDNTLSKLNNYGFNKVLLINFGHNMKNALSKYKNIHLLKHKYNKKMNSTIREFDIKVFDDILNQIKEK